jgi:primosomal protein N'
MAMVRGRHRHHLIVKAGAGDGLERARTALLEFADASARPRVMIDVDPVSML